MKNLFTRFVREDDGQDLVEYALLLVFIALVVALALPQLGVAVADVYTRIIASLA
jgi:Flp pilus assembly pilin Flp